MKRLKKYLCLFLALVLSIPFVNMPAKEVSAANDNVIFIKDGGTGDGSSADQALAAPTGQSTPDANTALYAAMTQLKAAGGGTIVICGRVELNSSNCESVNSTTSEFMVGSKYDNKPNVTITYTSVWDGVDYRQTNNAELVLAETSSISFPTGTKIENLTISSEDQATHYIAAGRNPITFGTGTYFKPFNNYSTANGYPIICGAYRNQSGAADNKTKCEITVDIGDNNKIGNIFGYCQGGNARWWEGGAEITIKSGQVIGNIYGDSQGANTVGVKNPIVINIEGGIIGRNDTVGGKIIGCNVGFDSSVTDKTVTINITGGDFTYCKSIQGYTTSVAEANRPTVTVDATGASTDLSEKLASLVDDTVTYKAPVELSNVIFIKDGGTGNGTSADSPLAAPTGGAEADQNTALYKAIEELIKKGGGTVVICGPYTLNNDNCVRAGATSSSYDFMFSDPYGSYKPNVTITYTSVWNGVDYRETADAKLILDGGASITFPTATVTKDLTVLKANSSEHYIAAGRNPLTLGEGTNFIPYSNANSLDNYPIVVGAYRNLSGIADNGRACEITVDIGDANSIGNVFGQCNGGNKNMKGGSTITVKSGNIGNVYGDSRATNQVGTVDPVTINIDGGTFKGVICGLNIGFDKDAADKDVYINITDGNFDKCAGIQGYGNVNTTDKAVAANAIVDASTTTLTVARKVKNLVNDTVTELKLPANYVEEGEQYVIYIKDGGTGNGTSADSPLAAPTGGAEPDENSALYAAMTELMKNGGGVIVVCGPYTLNETNCTRATSTSSYYDFMMPNPYSNYRQDVTITYTSVWDGVDYRRTANAELIMASGSSLTFPTATVLENITVRAATDVDHYISAGRCPLTLSKGTNFVPSKANGFEYYPAILGGYRNQNGIADNGKACTITIDIGDENSVGNIYGACNGGGKGKYFSGGITINIKSGKIGNVYGDSRIKNQLGIKNLVTINIEGGIFKGAIAGTNVGFDPASTDKNVKINITGGDFTDCTVIQGYTAQVTESDQNYYVAPGNTTVDASKASIEVARQVKTKADPSVNTLLLPDGYTDAGEKLVIFIKDGATGDGSSASSALKPTTGNYDATAAKPELQKDSALYQAMEKLMKSGGGVIVICGPYTLNNTNCQDIGTSSADFMMKSSTYRPDITITYTSVWDGVDYRKTANAELIMAGKSQLTFPTATVTENLTIRTTNDVTSHFISAGTNPLTLSKGTNFVPYAQNNLEAYPTILGAFRSNGGQTKIGNTNITVDIGDGNAIGNIYGLCNGGSPHTGDVTITVKSGTVGHIYGDSRATGQVTIDGDITMNLQGGTYKGLIIGTNVGFAGDCAKKVRINVTGGDFSNCQGIKSASNAVTGAKALSCIADATKTTNAIAQYVKWVADSSVTVLLPAGFNESTTGRVIFVKDGGTGDGTSANSALKPTTGNYDANAEYPERQKDSALYQAIEILMRSGGGTIVICGTYTLNDDNCQPIGASSADFIFPTSLYRPDVTITYTSVWDGVDYRKTANAELVMDGKASITFPTATVLKDITIRATDAVSSRFIGAGLNALTLDKGTNFIPYEEGKLDAYPMILGGFRSAAGKLKTGDTHITVDIGDENTIGNIYGVNNGGSGSHTGNSYITIKSGNIGGVYGDSRAVGQVPLNGDVYITIEGGIFRNCIAGVNTGFSGDCSRTVKMVITGGDFTKCTGIYAGTMAVSAGSPKVCTADLTKASIEVARQVKAVAMPTVTLLLPEGYTDPPKKEEVKDDKVEDTIQEEESPVGMIVLGASGAGLLVIGAVVAVLYFKKKKKAAK